MRYLFPSEAESFFQDILQTRPVDELHRVVTVTVFVPESVKPGDVAVPKLLERLDFEIKPLFQLGVILGGVEDNLQRHRTLDPRMPGFIDGTHSPVTDLTDNLERSDG